VSLEGRRHALRARAITSSSDVNVAGLISIPFAGPASIGATVANALLSDGVDIMDVGGRPLKRGTPVYVTAERGADEVAERLKEVSVELVPVLKGLVLLGFFDATGISKVGRPASAG
jgi:hypothetical protein